MADKPQKITKVAQSADIMNTIRDNASAEYQAAVPEAIKVGDKLANGREAALSDVNANRREIGDALMSDIRYANAFLGPIFNRVAKVIVTSRLYNNPWAIFKKGFLEYGEIIEDIFVEIAKPYGYDPVAAQYNVGKRYLPDVKSAFYQVNFEYFYPVTVNQAMLRRAFLTAEGVAELIDKIIEQIYTAANYDEFLTMKYLIMRNALDGKFYPVNIPEPTAANARQVTTSMVAYAKNVGYMSQDYNFAGVRNYSDVKYLYTILNTELSSIFDVEVLALSFNMSKAELLGNQVGVDGFGTMDFERLKLLLKGDKFNLYKEFTDAELASLSTVKGVMIDESYIQMYDNLAEMTEFFNDEGLEWTYRYHRWATYFTSPFATAILFTTANPAVTSISISPNTASVTAGQTVQFTANVTTSGFADKSVTWTTSDESISIDSNGIVSVPADASASSVTISATSTYQPTVTATATLTIVSAVTS